jgi:aspartyl-tRNA(Asn)/glutamyl-tRNA(Gln) amidotransferase subunit A
VPVGAEHQPVRNLMLRLTQLFNLTGQPAISLPFARTSSGLPLGLQMVGTHGHTEGLLRSALAIERVIGRV